MPALDVDTPRLVVAIDGPSGSGKSTVARAVARRLGLRYLDTGAMYRALTWWVQRNGTDIADPAAVLTDATTFELAISTDPADDAVAVAGHDVTAAIRSAAVTRDVSAVSAIPGVRRLLVAQQRLIVGAGGIVVEGRDIGTMVCPDAPVKIFLSAAVDTRAARRALQAGAETEQQLGVGSVRADIQRRDRLDSSRAASPLQQAPDAVALDTTAMDVERVVAAVLALVYERTGVAPVGTVVMGSAGGDRR